MEEQTWPARPIYSRRRVLALGGAAVAAAILAACGNDDNDSSGRHDGARGRHDRRVHRRHDSGHGRHDARAPTDTAAVDTHGTDAAGGTNAAKFGGGGGDGTLKIGFTAPLTGAAGGLR